MGFVKAKLKLKQVGATWVVDPTTVFRTGALDFSLGSSPPVATCGTSLTGQPFTLSPQPTNSGPGGAWRFATLSFNSAFVQDGDPANWHPHFDHCCTVQQTMLVNGTNETLFIELHCLVHPCNPIAAYVKAVARAVVELVVAVYRLFVAVFPWPSQIVAWWLQKSVDRSAEKTPPPKE